MAFTTMSLTGSGKGLPNLHVKMHGAERFARTDNFVSGLWMQAPTQCPVAFATRAMGGKWKPRIVWALIRNEKLRYSEIRHACPPISDRILSKELKELEAWGLISKRENASGPPKIEYALTQIGQTLRPVMAAMAEWGSTHHGSLTEPKGG